MTPPLPGPSIPAGGATVEALDYSRALLNILEDATLEQDQLRDTQIAVLNILDDFAEEKGHLEDMKKAVMNILDDLGIERDKLQETQMELLKSEQAIRSSLREKETLLKEVHHRVKNNLQVIASLLRLQSRYLQDEQSRAMFEESQNRVHSISLVHEMLYRTADLSRVDFGEYLRTLTTHLCDGWKATGRAIELSVDAAGVHLTVDTAIPCGLIVNELVTNALKHAFPDTTAGSIRITAAHEPPGWLKVVVQDNGIGLPENLNLRRSGSLGLELVNSLVRQLHATLEVRRDAGTAFNIQFQVPTN